jgi:serine/threonine-protein kinase
MANVWVARVTGKHGFEKLVALKTILPGLASSKRFRDMFIDESRIAAGIEHPNVAQILDVGDDDETLYLVMEYVDGESLARLMRAFDERNARVPLGAILRVLADTCGGLHAAHMLKDKTTGEFRGVVHRDVSPQNILVNTQGVAKLIDFGIAKAKDRLAQQTSAGGLKGKVQYMAPEQALGGDVDRRADLWAVGAILYEAIMGFDPYSADTDLSALTKIGARAPIAPLPSNVHLAVREVALRALSYEREDRFETALEMQRLLEEAMTKAGLQTTHREVGIVMEQHLAMRIEARRKEVELAMRAASQPAGGGAKHEATALGLEPPRGGGAVVTLNAGVQVGTQKDLSPAFIEARTAFPSSRPPLPPSAVPNVVHVVPELDLPPAPAVALRPQTQSPAPPRDAAKPIVPPPVMIASAAGSIIGDDVRSPTTPTPATRTQASSPEEANPKESFLDPAKIAKERAQPLGARLCVRRVAPTRPRAKLRHPVWRMRRVPSYRREWA